MAEAFPPKWFLGYNDPEAIVENERRRNQESAVVVIGVCEVFLFLGNCNSSKHSPKSQSQLVVSDTGF